MVTSAPCPPHIFERFAELRDFGFSKVALLCPNAGVAGHSCWTNCAAKRGQKKVNLVYAKLAQKLNKMFVKTKLIKIGSTEDPLRGTLLCRAGR